MEFTALVKFKVACVNVHACFLTLLSVYAYGTSVHYSVHTSVCYRGPVYTMLYTPVSATGGTSVHYAVHTSVCYSGPVYTILYTPVSATVDQCTLCCTHQCLLQGPVYTILYTPVLLQCTMYTMLYTPVSLQWTSVHYAVHTSVCYSGPVYTMLYTPVSATVDQLPMTLLCALSILLCTYVY
ncbi:hypothetical protein WDU94_010439 [Cyamophila willieti]